MVRRTWQDLDGPGHFCHWWQDLDERSIYAMSLLILAAAVALLVLGLERNARRTRRHLPLSSGWLTAPDRRDRDTERLLDELRSRG